MAQGRPASINPRNRSAKPGETLSGSPVDAPALWHAEDYCPRTLAWWDMWAHSPQAESFFPSDWTRLIMLAQVVDEFFMGDTSKLAEIRLNEEKLGATVRDRQNLRMVIKKDNAEDKDDGNPQDHKNVVRLKTAFKEAS